MLALCSAIKDDLGFSPPEMVFGSSLAQPGLYLDRASTASFANDVKKPLDRPYRGPYKVVECDPKFFTVQKGKKKDTASINRLKPAFGPLPLLQDV